MAVLPRADDTTRFYWEGARRGELLIQRCGSCRGWVHPPQPACLTCGGEVSPEAVSGRGTVHTYTIAHREVPGHKVPFAVVLVELEEQQGLRVLANLQDCPLDRIRIGMPVEVTFQRLNEAVTLPQFRPRKSASSGLPTSE